ncbi:type V CRISPR-associated protein Cas12a/Cpf1 [Phocaeicola oris]|uniref:type V CRISPR-associated protein Cas12a/Cpf1 n=1 Tax=Phocaeicola oris TaxID=2896850 RepID=UPI00234E3FC3|nr:type V CRISPR-associated protein Cas12a/Cpf1 [Phocaeicola oris]MCE2615800.1 type V CRISPR-associated protein Cas12a/Cpf1 [Phocaeicola oris]
MNNTLKTFTNLYPLSKTLRFELKPIGKTVENMKNAGIFQEDEHRAESYKKVKKIIDEYHKTYIEHALSECKLVYENENKQNSLQEYYNLYILHTKTEVQNKEFEKVHENLRKQITYALTNDPKFKTINKKELIKKDLPTFVTKPEDMELVKEFSDFTTYFTGFHQNRMNMYSSEAKSTAIAYRLIHENLPKFIDNINTFQKIAESPIAEKLATIYMVYSEQGYLNVNNLNEIFSLNYYSTVLTQTQIEIYNAVIGGKIEEDGIKIQGINEYINLYNQKQEKKEDRLPKLKPLFKQILSDREQISWLQEEFSNDNQVLSSIDDFCKLLADDILDRTKILLQSVADYDLSKIYLNNDLQLTDISQKIFSDWSIIKQAIEKKYETDYPQGKIKEEVYEKRKAKYFKSFKNFRISFINECLQLLGDEYHKKIENYIAKIGALNTTEQQTVNFITQITISYNQVKDFLSNEYPKDRNLVQDKDSVAQLKNLLDNIKNLQRFIKPLLDNGEEPDKDDRFYGELAYVWDVIDNITPLYNKVRNYLTRKPYSIEKIKLNFENSQLLNGWDMNKETDNTSIILRKGGLYYLAIMNKKNNKIFEGSIPTEEPCYEKMNYKLLPGASKMFPKVFLPHSDIKKFDPSDNIISIYDKGTYKKGDNFSLKDCHDLIDFFKASINKYESWKNFDFNFSDTETYENLNDFYREVDNQGYKISFRNVSVNYINSLVDEGKLYLFQIYNKDFSPYSKGTPNMHTLYWKMVFDERNLADVIYKLNGQAEIFFRKSSLHYDRPTHPANQPINNKNIENSKKQSVFDYDLIKDKRYTIDKFQFHVSITMNFKSTTSGNINSLVNKYIRSTKDLHFIGIDRGERHLLYLTVIDSKGNIKEQYSLNEITNKYNGNTYHTNYHDLLNNREAAQKKERQSWQTIENIKELKQGFLSQVIHKIAQLIIKYNAIVILEDLSIGFKRSRQKIESSVYQQFEKSLIDKLNYLVDKTLPAEAYGGLLHAYQLTNQFKSFQNMGKQNGVLLYIPAWNTSKIDPVTGFVNLFSTRYESIIKAQTFFSKFDSIKYNSSKGWFELKFDYNNFTQKAKGTQTKWTLCTWGTRIKTFRNSDKNFSWDNKEFDLSKAYQKLFEDFNIDIKNNNLKEAIVKQNSKDFFERLLCLLKLTLQMRNSMTGTEIDYIVSPVADTNGNFYDSRTCGSNLPMNADANGAYNIARKGLWMAEQIRNTQEDKSPKLTISNKEWLLFAQQKPYLPK